jgi:catechol 2,3-dioxygenase-like lactoylglutathione lyase family enzyme
MVTRFDHAVIAVGDLEKAAAAYRLLGFDVEPGGRHDRGGTHNSLVRFDSGYLELLAVHDTAEASKDSPDGSELMRFLREREGGLLGYALATDDVEAEAARFASAGLQLVGPFAMQRTRPDGRVLSWRLLALAGATWRRRWPFFIQWDEPNDPCPAPDRPGKHPNGASSVGGIRVAVRDLREAVDLYSLLLDSSPFRRVDVPSLAATQASFDIGGFVIDLLAPAGEGPVLRMLLEDGEGPVELSVVVVDLGAAGAILGKIDPKKGVRTTPRELLIPAELAFGARLVLTLPA